MGDEARGMGMFVAGLGQYNGCMFSFNLRFDVASTPRQRNAYDELFTKLRALRDQLFPRDDAPMAIGAPVPPHPEWATEFFSGMKLDEIQQKKPLTPPKPADGQQEGNGVAASRIRNSGCRFVKSASFSSQHD